MLKPSAGASNDLTHVLSVLGSEAKCGTVVLKDRGAHKTSSAPTHGISYSRLLLNKARGKQLKVSR